MAYNSVTYIATGSNSSFRNPYYVSDVSTYIKVYLNGAEVTEDVDYTWINTDFGITMTETPDADDTIKIEDREHEVTTSVDTDSTLSDCIAYAGSNRSLIETNITDIQTLETKANTTNPARMALIEADVTTLQSQQSTLSSSQSALESADDAQDLLIATNTANISTNATNISALSDQASAIAALQAQDVTHTANIATNTANITSNDSDIQTLQSRMNNVELGIGINAREGKGTLSNNVSATDLDSSLSGFGDCWIDGDAADSGYIIFEIKRSTDDETRVARVVCDLMYIDETWYIGTRFETVLVGNLSGVTFTVTDGGGNRGQVQYATDDMSGANYSGQIRWQIFDMRNTY